MYRCWGKEKLTAEEYRESIEALKTTPWGRFTDNFLSLWTKPGEVDWFSEDFAAVIHNAGLLARIAKETSCKGIMFDTELYKPPVPVWNYNPDNPLKKSFAEYQQQVRLRGREFMQAINREYPDVTIMLTFGYSQAFSYVNDPKFGALEKVGYALLPSFLDGMLETATEKTVLYDGWEGSYGYKGEGAFVQAREKMLVEGPEKWTAVPDKFRQHYRASFGLWVDLDYGTVYPWDTKNFARNYFTPEEFGFSLYSAFKHTDRYVWVWGQKIAKHGGWWGGQMPRPYVDALNVSRGDHPELYFPYEECFDYVGHQAAGSSTPNLAPYKGNQQHKAIGVDIATFKNDFQAGAASVKLTWISPPDGPSLGGIEKRTRVNMTGKRFNVWVKPLTPETVAEVSVAFVDEKGKEAELRTWNNLPADWTRLEIVVGQQGSASQFTRDPNASSDNIAKIVFYGVTREANQRAVVLWDDFTESTGAEANEPKQGGKKAAKPTAVVPSSPAKPSAESLAGWWKCSEGEGETLTDSSPSANHGILHGTVWTKSPSGYALEFKPGAWVEFPKPVRLTDTLTIMLWVKFDPGIRPGSAKGYPTLIYYGVDGDFSYSVTLQATMGKLGFGASRVNTEGPRTLHGVRSIRDTWEKDDWHHFAVTCDLSAQQMTVYVDGALHDTADFDVPVFPGYNPWKLSLGVPPGWKYGHTSLSGAMRDVRIYKNALSAEEIAAAYQLQRAR